MILLLCLALQASAADELARRLGDESGPVRDDAMKALRAMGDEAVPALRKAQSSEDPEVRGRAAQLLRHIEWSPWIDPALLNRYPPLRELYLAADHEGVLAWAGLHPSWEHGFEQHFEAYAVRLLDLPDLDLRKAATRALSEIEDRHDWIPRRPIRTLVDLICRWDPEACDDADQDWLAQAFSLVRRRSSRLDRPLFEAARARHPEAEKALRLLRAEGPALVDIAVSDTGWKRYYALEIIRETRYEPARGPLLRRFLEMPLQESWHLRQTLASIADPSCRRALLDQIPKLTGEGRSLLLHELAVAGAREAVPFLIEAVRSGNPGGHETAVLGLVTLHAPEVFDLLHEIFCGSGPASWTPKRVASLVDRGSIGRLLETLECPNDACRAGAAAALGELTDPDAQREVVRALGAEQRPEIRDALFWAATSFPALEPASGYLEEVLDRIARDPGDPLALPSAMRLLRLKGREALPVVEPLIERLNKVDNRFLDDLSLFPSDRLVPRMGRAAPGDSFFNPGFSYLARLGSPAARRELERVAAETKEPHVRLQAAFALVRAGGDGLRILESLDGTFRWLLNEDLLEHDLPGLRDLLRRQVRERGLEDDLLRALTRWAEPGMIPALLNVVEENDRWRTLPDPKKEGPVYSCFLLTSTPAHYQAFKALGATGDRSLIPFFLARLEDFDAGYKLDAARTLGRWKAREAVPALKRLVLSGTDYTRAVALETLGEIGAPGTADFVREQLRDNPHAAPYALARLGASCLEELAALLEDRGHAGPVVGALDLMAHPRAYAKIDALLPLVHSTDLMELPSIVEKVTGLPSRFSPGARASVCAGGANWERDGAVTLRDALHNLECGPRHSGGQFTHLYRDGAVEICTVEEAVEHWRKRFPLSAPGSAPTRRR